MTVSSCVEHEAYAGGPSSSAGAVPASASAAAAAAADSRSWVSSWSRADDARLKSIEPRRTSSAQGPTSLSGCVHRRGCGSSWRD